MRSRSESHPAHAAGRMTLLVLASLTVLVQAPHESRAADDARGWTHELGVETPLDALALLPDLARAAGAEGRGLMVRADLDLEDAYAQDPGLASLEEALEPLREAGLRPVLTLHFSGRDLPGPQEPERMARWEEALAALARLGAKGVSVVGVALPESLEASGRSLPEVSFLLKRTGVALRTVQRDLTVLLDLPEPVESWLEPLLSEDVGPYIDGVALAAPEDAGAEWVARQARALLRLRPGLRLLTSGWSAGDPAAVVETYLRAVGAGASAALFRPPVAPGEEDFWALLARLRGEIPERMPPAPPAAIRFLDDQGREVRVAHGHFFDPEAFDAVVWYRAEAEAPAKVEAVLATPDAVSPSVVDPLSGEMRWISLWVPDRRARTTRFDVPLRGQPLLLRYHREIPAAGERGDLKVATERIPPVEEILARHQEFQAAQDRRLRRWVADATIGLHYRVGTSGGDFDLTYDSTVYAEPEGSTEWAHHSLLFNGAPYRGKKLPDLPYVLPERVVEVPLRLTLDKRYTYRLAGRDTLDGAETWVVEFGPLDPARNLYRGKVWIDAATYVRRRLSAVQTRVETPLLSVEDELHFEPLPGPGEPLWVLKRSRGQQVITVSGRNLVLVREIDFTNFRINPPDFDEQRQAALASPGFIVRETAEGYQTLDLKEDGTRVPRPSGIQKTLLLLGGVFFNESVSVPVPLAGVNYFNFKTGGRDLHLEVFAAGAFNFANLTDPNFLGSRWEVGADLSTRAFPLTDRFLHAAAGGEEIEEFGVDDITQTLSFLAARPLGSFFKFTGSYEIDYVRFSRDEETRAAFETPSDTIVHGVEARLDFDRQGTSVRLFGRASRRATWSPWGFPSSALGSVGLVPEDAAGTLLEEFDPDSRDFLQYGLTLSRLWTPGLLQTLRGELGWMQGDDLDRFSKFRFSSLGDLRVRGFGGSGVRFDQGGLARGVYTFKVGPLLRLDAALEHARVRERDLGQREFLGFTGLGLAGNFTLPGGWVVRLDYGIGLSSDLEEREGEQEILLVLLRLL